MKKFIKNNPVLISSILAFISITAGLHLMLVPEKISNIIIIMIGIGWFIQGVTHTLDALTYLKKKKQSKETGSEN